MPRRVVGALGALVSLVLLAGACSGSEEGEPTTSDTSAATTALPAPTTSASLPEPAPVAFSPCPEVHPRAECGTLEVPLDYAQPEGETITIAVSRIAATDPAQRLGVMLVNPGGPGGEGLGFGAQLLAQADALGTEDQAVLHRFDVIGFDPRGVGASTPVTCGDPTAVDAADYTPDDDGERAELLAAIEAFAQACQRETGALLAHVDSVSAARDLDQVRRALGEEQVNLFGFSYGTLLFATYADLFPERVRTAVLDGAVAPSLEGPVLVEEQAAALETQMTAFLSDCEQRGSGCTFDGPDALDRYAQLMADWDASPLPTDEGDILTASQARSGYASLLFSDPGRAFLERALSQADGGSAAPSRTAWSAYVGGSGATRSNFTAAVLAVNCLDFPWPRGSEGVDALTGEIAAQAPLIGDGFLREFLPCALWPVRPVGRSLGPAAGSPPIVVIGTTGDPSTPYAWSEVLAEHLDSGVLLTREGLGHTGWGASTCVDQAVSQYLVTLVPPISGTVCPSP